MMRPGPGCSAHPLGGRLAAVEVAVQVGRQQAVPVLARGLEEGPHHDPGGVVDPDVETAPALHGRVREGLDVRLVAGVALQDERLAALGLDASRRLGRARRVALEVARHVGSLPCQRHGDGLADAARDARDDGIAPRQAVDVAHADGRRDAGRA